MSKEILILDKKDWPPLIFETPFIPEKLYFIGKIPDYSQKFISIVGSRKFSLYGKEVCEYIIEGLKGYPITIVSGLALGIDSIAHRKALECGLTTIAVPGSGLAPQTLYPPKNHRLADEIIKNGGCLISEFEPEMPALPWMFPQRNRIMAGMSHMTLIIEAEEKSGTLITARLALDYNREVGAIPHDIFSPTGRGPNSLLRQGAHLITSATDILYLLGFNPEEKPQTNFNFSPYTQEEILILKILENPKTFDEIKNELNIETQKINQIITILEIKNIITKNGIFFKRK